jgi:hypothetical protein
MIASEHARWFSAAATSRLEGPNACSRFAGWRCAGGIASECFPARLGFATTANRTIRANRLADFLTRSPHTALRSPPLRRAEMCYHIMAVMRMSMPMDRKNPHIRSGSAAIIRLPALR